MDIRDHIGSCQREEFIVTFQRAGVVLEAAPSIIFFPEPKILDRCAHGAIHYEHPLVKNVSKLCRNSSVHGFLLVAESGANSINTGIQRY